MTGPFPVLSATRDGCEVRVVLDASGTFSKARRMVVTDYAPAVVEMLKDNADPKANEVYAAMDVSFAVQVGQLHAVFRRSSGLTDILPS